MVDYFESLGIELDQIEELMNVYDSSILSSIDLDNMKKIVKEMEKEGLRLEEIRDILSIDLELFTYDVSFIQERWEILSKRNIGIPIKCF